MVGSVGCVRLGDVLGRMGPSGDVAEAALAAVLAGFGEAEPVPAAPLTRPGLFLERSALLEARRRALRAAERAREKRAGKMKVGGAAGAADPATAGLAARLFGLAPGGDAGGAAAGGGGAGGASAASGANGGGGRVREEETLALGRLAELLGAATGAGRAPGAADAAAAELVYDMVESAYSERLKQGDSDRRGIARSRSGPSGGAAGGEDVSARVAGEREGAESSLFREVELESMGTELALMLGVPRGASESPLVRQPARFMGKVVACVRALSELSAARLAELRRGAGKGKSADAVSQAQGGAFEAFGGRESPAGSAYRGVAPSWVPPWDALVLSPPSRTATVGPHRDAAVAAGSDTDDDAGGGFDEEAEEEEDLEAGEDRFGGPRGRGEGAGESLARACAETLRGVRRVAEEASSALEGRPDPGQLAAETCRVLLGRESAEEASTKLFDVLGFGAFDEIGRLVEQRGRVAQAVAEGAKVLRLLGAEEAAAAVAVGGRGRFEAEEAAPDFGPQATMMVQTSGEVSELKQRRKDARREARQRSASTKASHAAGLGAFGGAAGAGEGMMVDDTGASAGALGDVELLGFAGFDAVLAALANMESGPLGESLRDAAFERDDGDRLFVPSADGMTRVGLPKGTTRRTVKGCEEVTIPPAERLEVDPRELVAIASMPPWARRAFKGYETLNRIQSRIFQTAFFSNENVLVCAPTGAGKTNIAMLAVLHRIKQHLLDDAADEGTVEGASNRMGEAGGENDDGGEDGDRPRQRRDARPRGSGALVDVSAFKIVYVAPMKALAAEVTSAFSERLRPLGLTVRELTGDMQLSRKELAETQMIVTTPEKWDVVTRKSGDAMLTEAVKLLVIDEVHLLNDERGGVIEALVARTLRQVESRQSMIRIVGLSATLPNWRDVARFLRANEDTGVFHFGGEYRPIPLTQVFTGVTEKNLGARQQKMVEMVYDKVVDALRRGKQVMVFVHSRKDTAKTARQLSEMAARMGDEALFVNPGREAERYGLGKREAERSRTREVAELFQHGLGVHHAGMPRTDRTLEERLFKEGLVQVLCCTATLAWGVNLPAHTVVIKGTQLYNPDKGDFVDLGVLDVLQIFGRAGRPGFDTSGEGHLVTTHDRLAHYLTAVTSQVPIESRFLARLEDGLNAEVALGTVASVAEGCVWLSYTYLLIRMKRNPLAYGLTWADVEDDPSLMQRRELLIQGAARTLMRCRMVHFNEATGAIHPTDTGGVAAHFYLSHATVDTFNHMLRPGMGDPELFDAVCHASEFANIQVREEELGELDALARDHCPVAVKKGVEHKVGKCNALLQAYLSGAPIKQFALQADANYVAQNAGRILRGIFELIVKKPDMSQLAETVLTYCKAMDRRCWPFVHPLRQAPVYGHGHGQGSSSSLVLGPAVLQRLEDADANIDYLRDADLAEVADIIRGNEKMAADVRRAARAFPALDVDVHVQPLTRSLVRLTVGLRCAFEWRDAWHGGAEPFWLWVESTATEEVGATHASAAADSVLSVVFEGDVGHAGRTRSVVSLVHSEHLMLAKAQAVASHPARKDGGTPIEISVIVALDDAGLRRRPEELCVRLLSDRWLNAEASCTVPLGYAAWPSSHDAQDVDDDDDLSPFTPLDTNLPPTPRAALMDEQFMALYRGRLDFFNEAQTQCFDALFNSDDNAFIAAPHGCGKTVMAELAMLRLWRRRDGNDDAASSRSKVLCLCPLEALVRKRVDDWAERFRTVLGKKVAVLAADGDGLPSFPGDADVVVGTPEAWDAVTRAWDARQPSSWARFGLVLVDEVHLLDLGSSAVGGGGAWGSVRSSATLEAVVSRLRFLANYMPGGTRTRAGKVGIKGRGDMRVVAFSSVSLRRSSARDVGDWLGCVRAAGAGRGVVNLSPAIRPVPLTIHLRGFPGKHYCPRVAAMNKPCFTAILDHCPGGEPVLIFVSSRRQARLTAMDLIALLATAGDPERFLGHCRPTPSSSHGRAVSDNEDAALGAAIFESSVDRVSDATLKHTLRFGIGLVHSGLARSDRDVVETLFKDGRIQVCLACCGAADSSEVVWGTSRALSARLVIVKGTEWYDASARRYAEYPTSDVLHMCSFAGRPYRDSAATALLLVHDSSKPFYAKALHEPYPLESPLAARAPRDADVSPLARALVAEIAHVGVLASVRDVHDWVTWTFFHRRAASNPGYYGIELGWGGDIDSDIMRDKARDKAVGAFMDDAVRAALRELEDNGCCSVHEEVSDEDGCSVAATPLGCIAARHGVSPVTVHHFASAPVLQSAGTGDALLQMLCEATEYASIPMRYGDEERNANLQRLVVAAAAGASPAEDKRPGSTPRAKARLLLEAHMARVRVARLGHDCVLDSKMVVMMSHRLARALVDVAIDTGAPQAAVSEAKRLVQHLAKAIVLDGPRSDSTEHAR